MAMHSIQTTMEPGKTITVDETEYQYLLKAGLIYSGSPVTPVADFYDDILADKIANGSATPQALGDAMADASSPFGSAARAALVTRDELAINALHYLDGVRTDTQAINQAISDAHDLYVSSGSYVTVYVPPKDGGWTITRAHTGVNVGGGIELRRGVRLKGDHTKLQLAENCFMIYAESPESNVQTVTADTTLTDTSLTITDSSGYAVGDTVYVRLGQSYYDALEPAYWFFATITAIPDATHITLDRTVGYAMSVAATTSTNQRSVRRLDEYLEMVDIDGFDLHSTGLTPESTEGGIHPWKVGHCRIANVTGRNMGAGLIFSFFVDNLETDNLRVLGSVSPSGRDTWGRGFNLAETRVANLRNTYAENLERNFATIESTCEAIRWSGVKMVCNNATFNAQNLPVIRHLNDTRVVYEDLFIQGSQLNTLYDTSSDTDKSSFLFRNATIRTSVLPIIKDLSDFEGDLRIQDKVYRDVRRVSRTFPLTANMANQFLTLPSGLARKLRIYVSTKTGLTSMYLYNGTQNGSEISARLVAGQTVRIDKVCGISPPGTNYKWNDAYTKQLRVNTDGTVPAGAYITVELEYYLPADGSDDGSAARTDLSTVGGPLSMTTLGPLIGAPMQVGLWYSPGASSITTGQPPEQFERAIPLIVGRDCTVDQLAVSITTAGTTGAVMRLGLRADNAGIPGNLLVDAGTVDGTVVGDPAATLASPVSLSAGTRVWLTAVCQGAATTRPTVRQNNNTTPSPSIGASTASLALDTTLTGYQGGSGFTGAFPTTQGSWTQTNLATRIAAHVSA